MLRMEVGGSKGQSASLSGSVVLVCGRGESRLASRSKDGGGSDDEFQVLLGEGRCLRAIERNVSTEGVSLILLLSDSVVFLWTRRHLLVCGIETTVAFGVQSMPTSCFHVIVKSC